MADPLFSVGESVWLVSNHYPELSAATQVESVVLSHGEHTNGSRFCGANAYYFLGIATPSGAPWCECALRKRPPPEPLVSFDDIMAGLKIVEKVE